MGQVYFCSDLHVDHKNIWKFRPGLTEENCKEENRELIRKHWRATKFDTVYMIGDIFIGPESHEFIKSLPGKKILIMGNHDFERKGCTTLEQGLTAVVSIHGTKSKSYTTASGERVKLIFSHIPLHPEELRKNICVHGHIHDKEIDYMNFDERYDKRFVNVNMDVLLPRTGKIMLDKDELLQYALLK